MKLYDIQDQGFRKYGRRVTDSNAAELIKVVQQFALPEEVVYEPSVKELEILEVSDNIRRKFFGELPAQIGYCIGHNERLNALEYHRSSEFIIAASDLVLLLGYRQDISEEYTYDTSLVEAFFVSQGTCVELYATTLHYAPCNMKGKGFRAIIVLPEGTNTPVLEQDTSGEAALLTAKNKWLIAHPDAHIDGAYPGLTGENLTVPQ